MALSDFIKMANGNLSAELEADGKEILPRTRISEIPKRVDSDTLSMQVVGMSAGVKGGYRICLRRRPDWTF